MKFAILFTFVNYIFKPTYYHLVNFYTPVQTAVNIGKTHFITFSYIYYFFLVYIRISVSYKLYLMLVFNTVQSFLTQITPYNPFFTPYNTLNYAITNTL